MKNDAGIPVSESSAMVRKKASHGLPCFLHVVEHFKLLVQEFRFVSDGVTP